MKHTAYLIPALLLLCGLRLDAQQFFFSSEQPSSCNAADGIITIVPTRGVPPFTYQWSTGATDLSVRNVTKGTYSATLTDATGATVVHSHILNSKELDIYLIGQKPATFCNPNAGALTLDIIGGAAPYAYIWSDGQTTATASGLTWGTYSVTVQDATGCVAWGEYTVLNQPASYYPNAAIEQIAEPDCINTTNGELKASMLYSGFTPNTYLWSTGATTEAISGLSAGVYSVTVTDDLGCARSTSYTLQKALSTAGSVICTGTNNGTATAELINATAPVSYQWSNGQSGPLLSNLPNGFYTVTATDANGCSAAESVSVTIPTLALQDYSPYCYSGNNGVGYAWVSNDDPVSFLWDDGFTQSWNNTMSPGPHSVTVTTTLGCTLVGSVNIDAPQAPPFQISVSPNPADCLNSIGGSLNVSISGGTSPYSFYASGPNGFFTNNLASLQNLQAGQYYLSAYSNNTGCSNYIYATLSDASGFNPELVVTPLDCITGVGSAAVTNVTQPGVQYSWSMGATTPDVYNLTQGVYAVTVTGGGNCVQYYNFDLYGNDTLQNNPVCGGIATGTLIDDQGTAGCGGTAGIAYQMIRTLPSGALNFTDANGVFQVLLPAGTFDLEPASYDPVDIACPANATHTVNSVVGGLVSGLDFHFYNNNPVDHRVRQRTLRTAQPGYPFSLRYEVCNDGSSATAGTMTLDYGNFFGSVAPVWFEQHPGNFSLNSETPGTPDNSAVFNFPGVAPGTCELMQVDFTTPTTTTANTPFITRAGVTPLSGDPTPDNNVSTLYNTVMGSYDPNSVFAYPARNGNPRDGGDILQSVDRRITYQIMFQNTGNAPANIVIVRDTLDPKCIVTSISNISASHNMLVSVEGDNNNVLVFKFPNINLADSTSDYANSIGSIQYDIDLAPGLPIGAEVDNQAAIYFDFNSPVITNNNKLKVVSALATGEPDGGIRSVITFPNPADSYFGFYNESACEMTVFDALGAEVIRKNIDTGLQQVQVSQLPGGIYHIRLDAGGQIRNGKVVVSH